MTVYLGDSGTIELCRTAADVPYVAEVDPAEVNASTRRLNFGFKNNDFMTGDLLEFTRLNASGAYSKSNLDFVVAADFPDGKASPQSQWFVSVDEQGGVRLFDTFSKALDGSKDQAAQLATPASTYNVEIKLKNNAYRCFGQLRSFELNTDREVVDTTVLGEYTRQKVSSLISGSGNLVAFWDYKMFTSCCSYEENVEVSHYLHQLILRQDQGSNFSAKFTIKCASAGCYNDSVYYEAEALVTQAALSFSADEVVTSRLNFVTTGRISLKIGVSPVDQLVNMTGGGYDLENDSGRLELNDP